MNDNAKKDPSRDLRCNGSCWRIDIYKLSLSGYPVLIRLVDESVQFFR